MYTRLLRPEPLKRCHAMQTLAVAWPVKGTKFQAEEKASIAFMASSSRSSNLYRNMQELAAIAKCWRCICSLNISFWLSLSFRSRSSYQDGWKRENSKSIKVVLLLQYIALTQQETSLLPFQVLLSLKGFKSKLHGNQWDIPICRLLEARPTSKTWIQITVSNKF